MADKIIKYGIEFDVQKKNLQALKSSLQEIQKINFNDIAKFNNSSIEEAKRSLINIKTEAVNVESALKQAFNVKLNTVNVDSFNQALAKSGSSLSQVYQEFSKAGPVGQATFRNLANSVLDVNLQLRQTHPLLDKMATTFANTVKWQAASSAVNAMTRSVQQAWGFTKSLDGTLNDIRIVTGKNADEMDRFAIKANAAAQQLGKTTTDYTKASLIYAQQGLSDEQIQARTAITLKTANVTGQSTEEVSEQLTAVWNGYKVNADQAELYVDRLAAVAATTASDLEELSTGMSKVASAAAAMGVGEDQLAAQLATIISVTKQAPESVGTALRTIYARISDIKAGISQDDVTLGNYSGKMAELGFNVLDVNGNLRDMGQVIEEIGGKWGSLTREQQVSLTQTMAGQRQYNNLLALFDNFEQYNETLATAQQAAGTLEQQQSIYMEGMAAHLNSLKAAVEGIYKALFDDTDSINDLLDGLKDLANFTSQFVESIGGGVGVLRTLGAVGMTVFNDQIARGITTMITNFQAAKANAMQLEASINTISKLQQENPNLDIDTQRNLQSRRALLKNINVLSPEEYQQGRQKIVETDQALTAVAALQKEKQEIDQLVKKWGEYAGVKQQVNQIYNNDHSTEKIIESLNKVEELKNSYDELRERIENLDPSNENFKQDWVEIRTEIIQTVQQMNKLQQAGLLTDNQIVQFQQLRIQFSELFTQADKQEDEFFEQSNGNGQVLINTYTRLKQILDSVYSKSGSISENLNNDTDSNRYKFEKAQEQARRKAEAEVNNNRRIELAAQVKQYTNLASGIGRVATAIKQVQRLGSIWNDKDLSNGEKWLQTFMNIGMTAPMVVSGFHGISTALNLTTAAMVGLGAATGVAMAAMIAISAIDAKNEAIINTSRQSIEKSNQTQEEINKNLDLYNSIDKLNEQYENNEITRSELKSSIEDLLTQYNLEDEKIQDLTTHYGNLKDIVHGYRIEELQALKQENQLKRGKAVIGMKTAARGSVIDDQSVVGNRYVLGLKPSIGQSTITSPGENAPQLFNMLTNPTRTGELSKIGAAVNEDLYPFNGTLSISVDYDEQSLVKLYHALKNIADVAATEQFQGLETSGYYQGIQNWLEKMQPFVTAYQEADIIDQIDLALETLQEQDQNKLQISEQNVDTLSKYVATRKKLIDKAIQLGREKDPNYSVQQGTQAADAFLKDFHPEIFDKYNQKLQLYNELLEKFQSFPSQQKSEYSDLQDILSDIINNLDEGQLDFLQNLDFSNMGILDFYNILLNISKLDFSNVSEGLSIDKIKQDKQAASDRYVLLQSLQDQVSSGKSISKSEFKNISEQVPQGNWDQYFTMQANGTYKMTQDAKTFYNTVNSLKLDGFFSTIDDLQQQMSRLQSVARTTSAGDKYDGWKDFSSPATTLGADDQLTIDPFVGYDKVKDQLEYLDLVIDSNSELGKQIQQWKSLAEIQNLSVEDMQNISDLMEKVGDQTGNFKGVYDYLKEQTKELQHQIHDAMFPTDADIDQSDLAQLTDVIEEMAPASEDLADSLQEDQRAAEDVAEAILRFDDAIEDVVKNYDDWLAALESGTAQQQAEVIDDLRDAYADLLDLDGDSLSDSFLTSTENLNLMKAAIDGDTQAYNELLSKVQQDIAIQAHLDSAQFQSDFDNLLGLYYQGQNLDDLQVGASLNNQNFLNGLSQMVDAAFSSAQQAEDYLASMGVDAQVIEEKDSDTETKQITGFHAEDASTSIPYSFPYMIGEGGIGFHQGNMIVPGATYVPDTETVTDTKQNAAFSLKVISANKSSGGGFKFNQSKNGGGSGGQKRRSSGGGGKGKSCFVAGTLVSTNQGFENIENIKIGDIVLSYNLKTHQNEYSEVLQTMIHDTTEEIYSIHVQNDIIQSTGIHKFLIVRNQKVDWIPAQELKVTDLVHFSDGSLHKIDEIHIQIKTLTVYNFEVSNNHNYYVGQNGILVHNKGGKGGGGGKGSEPDKSQKDLKKALEDERDIYHDINIQIEKINRNLDRVQKKQDRLYGKQLLDNLNKQTQILQQQNLKLKEKQDLQQQDLRNQQQILKNLGVTFDKDGNISNYMDILGQKQAAVNEAIEKENQLIKAYNESTDKDMKKGIADEISKADKKVQQAQDELKKVEDKIKKYDETREAFEDITDQIEENLQQQIEIEIKKFRMEVQIRLDMGDAERDWNKFVRQVLQHDNIMTDSNFDKILKDTNQNLQDATSYYNIQGKPGTIQKLTDQLLSTMNQSKIMNEPDGWSAIYGDNQAQAMEDMQNDLDQLMNQMEDFEKLIQDIDKAYLDTIDDIQDQFDKQIEDYEYVNELLEHDMDLLKLVYGDRNYDAMDKYYSKLQENNIKTLDSLKRQRDFYKEQRDQALARGDTNAAKMFEENYKNTISKINDTIMESAKILQQQYENSVNNIFYNLDKKVSGGHGTDYLDMQWELMNKHADEYLDTINSAFAIQQTQRKYQKALDETKSIKNQQALKKLMNQQLDILKNKEKLTEYDVERAEKLLQVEQARIALEEAQSSKTSMRLKRDSQGNYSYEYVADKNAIDDAQANLATAQNDLYNFDKDRYQAVLNDMLSLWKEFQEKYKEITLDTSLTEEERVERLAKLRQQYGELINDKLAQNLDVRNNLMKSAFASYASLYNVNVDNFNKMSNEEKDILMNDLVPMWGSGIQQMTDKFAGEGGFIATCEDAFKRLQGATQQYQYKLREMAETAGFSFDDIINGIDETAEQMQLLIVSNQQLISSMNEQLATITQLRMQAKALTAQYELVAEAGKKAAQQIHNYLQEQKALVSYNTTGTSSGGNSGKSSTSGGTSSTKKSPSSTPSSTSGSTGTGSSNNGGGGGSNNNGTKSSSSPTKTTKKKKTGKGGGGTAGRTGTAHFATGGYTGEWNDNDGRFAILHQKELVLNEKDTENFLDSMYILRSITDSLNGNIYERLSGVRNSNIFSPSGDELEQNVHIEATFPNVDSKRQIEEAFSELVNMAAQRAMRR